MTRLLIKAALLGTFLAPCGAGPGYCGGPAQDPRIDHNIRIICRSKAMDPKARSLCVSYLSHVYYLDRRFGGWLGRIQAALRADIRGLNLDDFPRIRFGEVLPAAGVLPSGDSGSWDGSILGLDEGMITLSERMDGDDPVAELLLDHEICHHADAVHWDGTPSGENPFGGSEEACYAVEGCLVSGECRDPL